MHYLETPHYTDIKQGSLLTQVGSILILLQNQKAQNIWKHIFCVYGRGYFSLPLRQMLLFKH